MPDEPFLPLTRLKNKEKSYSWDDVCENLSDLLKLIEKIFIIDVSSIRYPPGIPFRLRTTTGLPDGVREMIAQEISDFELTAPTNGKWRWVVYDPSTLA